MSLMGAVIAPHPPILIPQIGQGEEREAAKTLEGMERMVSFVAERKPDVLVIFSPHGTLFSDGFSIMDGTHAKGDFSDFGYRGYQLKKELHQNILQDLKNVLKGSGFPYIFLDEDQSARYGVLPKLDHGALVPLYFIEQQYQNYKLIHITPGGLDLEETFAFGRLLGEILRQRKERILILASADLSHCLKDSGPYRYAEEGPVFDQILVESIREKRYEDLLNMKPHLYEPAGQCGLRSIIMMLGCLDGMTTQPKVFSYEGPYGVGYMTGTIAVEEAPFPREEQNGTGNSKGDPYVFLARSSMEHWVKKGTMLQWDEFKKSLDSDWVAFIREAEENRAGAFVSLHKEGRLRGCIGTIEATRKNLALEVIHNAVEACSFDPRFPGVEPWELNALDVKVDVLEKPHLIEHRAQLDPKKFGVIVEKGPRRGLLLPDIDGVDTVDEQLDIAMQKAGILSLDRAKIYRFSVVRHED